MVRPEHAAVVLQGHVRAPEVDAEVLEKLAGVDDLEAPQDEKEGR